MKKLLYMNICFLSFFNLFYIQGEEIKKNTENTAVVSEVVAVLKLKTDIENKVENTTQTKAWLSLKTNSERLEQNFPQYAEKPYKEIIEKALKKEAIYKDTHYVFYFPLSSTIKLIRDLYSELYKNKYKKTIIPGFTFLLLQTMNNKDFQKLYADTAVPENIFNAMIATNLSLFSNIESKKTTVNYFIHTQKTHIPEEWLFNFLDSALSLNNTVTSFACECIALHKKYFDQLPQNNVLMQIFIPKEQVNTMTYIAYKGIPFSFDPGVIVKIILNEIVNGVIMTYSGEHLFTNTFERLLWVSDVLGKKIQSTSKLYRKFKNTIDTDLENGGFKTAAFLHAFTTIPYIIPHSNVTIEGKILFPIRKLTIDQSSNILFFDYTALSQEKNSAYQQEIADIAKQIIDSVKI